MCPAAASDAHTTPQYALGRHRPTASTHGQFASMRSLCCNADNSTHTWLIAPWRPSALHACAMTAYTERRWPSRHAAQSAKMSMCCAVTTFHVLLHCAHGSSVHLAFLPHASCGRWILQRPASAQRQHTQRLHPPPPPSPHNGLQSACIGRLAHVLEGRHCGQACRAKGNKAVKDGHGAVQCRHGPWPMHGLLAADAPKPGLGNHAA